MIYIILVIITFFYLFFLLKEDEIMPESFFLNKKFLLTLSAFFIVMITIYTNLSNLREYNEYEKISKKHQEIRNNISKIKENIPALERRMYENPKYYEGWVMLAKSYLIIDDIQSSSESYKKAIALNSDDPIILKEYIATLRRLDPKVNKEKILDIFNLLHKSNNADIDVYNLKLNYSIEINDSALTRKTLKDIIENPKIKNKDSYIQAYENMSVFQSDFKISISLSEQIYAKISKYKNAFFILTESNKAPFAVKRIETKDLNHNVIIDSSNIMIKNQASPRKAYLSIKGSMKNVVDENLKEIYKSDLIDIDNNFIYKIN